jgi:hypothetical protein
MLTLQQLTPDILEIIIKKLGPWCILKILIFDDRNIKKFIFNNITYDNESPLILKRFENKKDYTYDYKKRIGPNFILIKKVVKNTSHDAQKIEIANIYGISTTRKIMFTYKLEDFIYEEIKYCCMCGERKFTTPFSCETNQCETSPGYFF